MSAGSHAQCTYLHIHKYVSGVNPVVNVGCQDNTWTTFSYMGGQQTYCVFIFQNWSDFLSFLLQYHETGTNEHFLPDSESVFPHI